MKWSGRQAGSEASGAYDLQTEAISVRMFLPNPDSVDVADAGGLWPAD